MTFIIVMSNRADSRKHGMHRIERLRPKKKFRVKKARVHARARQMARQDAVSASIASFEASVAA